VRFRTRTTLISFVMSPATAWARSVANLPGATWCHWRSDPQRAKGRCSWSMSTVFASGRSFFQDDNFSDLARTYAALGAQMLVVPTFEGPPAVAPYHLRNSALRAIENPIALVRSVAQGESSAVAPGGRIIDSFEPDRLGPGVMVTDVPVVEAAR
jgi:hypothetical protein